MMFINDDLPAPEDPSTATSCCTQNEQGGNAMNTVQSTVHATLDTYPRYNQTGYLIQNPSLLRNSAESLLLQRDIIGHFVEQHAELGQVRVIRLQQAHYCQPFILHGAIRPRLWVSPERGVKDTCDSRACGRVLKPAGDYLCG